MPGALENKVAVVTGAGRGIGAATARLFAQEGARVVLASRSEAQLRAVAEEINDRVGHDRAVYVPTDLSDEIQVNHLVKTTKTCLGPLDNLVYNASVVEVRVFSMWDMGTSQKG